LFEEIIDTCEFVFLRVKPQAMSNALTPYIKQINDSNAIIVTMAAALTIDYFEKQLGITRPIIRIMPNTPAAVGEGMILFDGNKLVTNEMFSEFRKILNNAGKLDNLSEHLIDAGSAVSGCGPAFAFMFAEALADAGVECGLPRDKALLYAAQMLKGSAELILQEGNPAVLKDRVCSPGGTTIAGVHALENGAFRAAAMNAVTSAYKRTLELK
jgi:pyrroline-5-carboxylate reductase